MAKKKKKSGGSGKLFLLGVLVVCAAAAGAYYFMNGFPFGLRQPAQKPIVTVTPRPVPLAPEQNVFIYLPKKSNKGLYLARVAATTRDKSNTLDAALKLLLDTNKHEGISAGLIPTGTKLLSPVSIHKGVATVNLSREFKDNFPGGSEQEALTVNSIAHTLVSNSEGKVSSVRILVNGETVETLGGHLELTDPIKADSTLLRPGGTK
jgi:germination protein M